jgi:hypothetical protein
LARIFVTRGRLQLNCWCRLGTASASDDRACCTGWTWAARSVLISSQFLKLRSFAKIRLTSDFNALQFAYLICETRGENGYYRIRPRQHRSNTESVVSEFSALLQSYGVSVVYGDRFGQHWTSDAFARYGIELKHSPYDRSQLYLNLIPALGAGQVKLLDLPRLRSQFLALERRILRSSGKEIIDHPSSGADDLANSAAGALVMAATADRRRVQWWTGSEFFNEMLMSARPGTPAPSDTYSPGWSCVYNPSDPHNVPTPPRGPLLNNTE